MLFNSDSWLECSKGICVEPIKYLAYNDIYRYSGMKAQSQQEKELDICICGSCAFSIIHGINLSGNDIEEVRGEFSKKGNFCPGSNCKKHLDNECW